MKKHQRLAAILGINLFIFGVGILIIELLFGAWLNPNSLNRLNLIKSRTFAYDVSGLYQTDSPVIQYSRDKYGLRGTYGDPSRIDLLTVGGSTTDQRSVADGLTWQDVLQAQFASNGVPIMVANAGVDGQSTIGHIKDFDWWFRYVPNLKPKYILFYIGLNDFYVEGATDTLLQQSFFGKVKDNSALWHVVRTVRGVFKSTRARIGHTRIDFAALQWTDKPLQTNYEFLAPRLDAYRQRLGILVDKTRSFGSQPIFVTQPSRQYKITSAGVLGRSDVSTCDNHQINGLDYYRIMRQFDKAMETVCHEQHASFVDLAATGDWQDSDFYDFAHMTPAGARKVGERIFENLKPVVTARRG